MILVLDHYDSFIFNIIDIVKQYGHKVHHAFYDKISISEIEALKPTKIILSPGPKHPDDAPHSQDIIRFFGEKNIPILGICLGHQLIGCTYGAHIYKTRPAHGIKDKVLHDKKGLFEDMVLPLEVGRYHSLSVSKENMPKDLHINALNEEGVVMGISHKKYPILGVQFHPESILTQDGKKIIFNFLNI